ncbi:MAG: PEP-CTERM sorting domain-containing protein [Spirochaetales bacterium]|nr:PEP-CTERM sorting domain-containing protein [Spirochaetales bacterium]
MKLIVTTFVFLSLSVNLNAGLINWQSTDFGSDPDAGTLDPGDLVALYIDVNGDSGLSGLVVNTDFTVNSLASSVGMADDLFAGFTTVVNLPIPAIPTIKGINSTTPNVADNVLIYSVMFDSPSLSSTTLGLISDDSPFNSGSVVAPGTPLQYNALGSDGILTGNMGGVSVIPEPTTLMALLVGIVGLVGFRRHLLKK